MARISKPDLTATKL